MTNKSLTLIRTREQKGAVQPVSQPITGKNMVKNTDGGGFVFELDDWQRLDRFLVLGSTGGTYYQSEKALTKQNAEVVEKLLKVDPIRVINRVVEFSEQNRVPKQDTLLFVLAMATGVGEARVNRAVTEALPRVARIGTHIFTFVGFATQFRGWGRGLRDAVANWYLNRDAKSLAYQAIKYQQREGWSHRDLLRLSHAHSKDAQVAEVLRWMVKGWEDVGGEPHPEEALRQIWAFERAKRASSTGEVVKLITDYRLPREAIPTEYLKEVAVWEALLRDMPMTALIRNLAVMSRNGTLKPMSDNVKTVVAQLRDVERLRRSRVHPIQLISALKVYETGGRSYGYGSSMSDPLGQVSRSRDTRTWAVLAPIRDALEFAFYESFGNVEPTGKRNLLAFDVSGSMDGGTIAGVPGLTPRDASAAMGMVTARSEWDAATGMAMYHSVAFSGGLTPLPLSPSDTLQAFSERMSKLPFEWTDLSLPIKYALDKQIAVDAFIMYTDNEVNRGTHPSQLLKKYRKELGIPAKLVVVAFTSTGFSISDPNDGGMLDLVGFDTHCPGLISSFVKGEF